jgi:antitoxin (DNA-binding transcriptional repressor) of toxin-antitoxin stability system
MLQITATELARKFKQMMNLVEFQGEELIIIRNNHQVAKIIPGPATMTALEAMSDLYRTLPEDAGTAWVSDSREGNMESLTNLRDPWAS